MKQNKLNIFIVLALALILIFASGQTGCKRQEGITFNTSALVINFVENAPPSELVTNEKYPIYIDANNYGGQDIAQGQARFYLSGVGENLRNVNLKIQNSNFLEKKTTLVNGGFERLIFATDAEPWKTLPASFDFIIKADSCYNYANIMQTSVCIGKGSGICSISGEKITAESNSAGPIQITSLTEEIRGNTLYVTFLIENKGSGEVYLPSSDCDKLQEGEINEKLKQNQVEVVVRTEEGFTCTLSNGLIGETAVGTVTCQKTISESESHITPFEVVVSYIYKESITKALTILPA